jgi:hypothetical protein
MGKIELPLDSGVNLMVILACGQKGVFRREFVDDGGNKKLLNKQKGS